MSCIFKVNLFYPWCWSLWENEPEFIGLLSLTPESLTCLLVLKSIYSLSGFSGFLIFIGDSSISVILYWLYLFWDCPFRFLVPPFDVTDPPIMNSLCFWDEEGLVTDPVKITLEKSWLVGYHACLVEITLVFKISVWISSSVFWGGVSSLRYEKGMFFNLLFLLSAVDAYDMQLSLWVFDPGSL